MYQAHVFLIGQARARLCTVVYLLRILTVCFASSKNSIQNPLSCNSSKHSKAEPSIFQSTYLARILIISLRALRNIRRAFEYNTMRMRILYSASKAEIYTAHLFAISRSQQQFHTLLHLCLLNVRSSRIPTDNIG